MLIAEFAPQSGVILTWPHARSDWHASLGHIVPVYLDIARAVSTREPLVVICYDAAHRETVTAAFSAADIATSNVFFTCIPSNDTWIRDYGPLAVARNGAVELQDFTFDGWNNRFRAELDNAVTHTLQAGGLFGEVPCRQHALVLEGGSIDCDGHGTLLTTSSCLLHAGRNAWMGRDALESVLQTSLGIERILWLDHGGLVGDDTDGHVDMLARFCSVGTIAYTRCDNPEDSQYDGLAAMEAQLKSCRDVRGEPYQLVPLPLPGACHGRDNQRLPASYANFMIINDAVLMPAYNDPADAVAQRALADCFPAREVIPVKCVPLIYQSGSLHCAALQLPAGVLRLNDGQ